jgi:hypothetical protein
MIRLKKLLKESQPPKDRVDIIDGDLPYVTIAYYPDGETENAQAIQIKFDDYDTEDQLSGYEWSAYLIGTDTEGNEWQVDGTVVNAHGLFDWDIFWDTLQKQ